MSMYNTFRWFLGRVEKIDEDPQQLGRVKVRIIHDHDGDINIDDTQWCQTMLPTTSESLEGVGDTPSLSVGSLVMGFYIDGERRRDPVLLGTIPIIPELKEAKNSLPPLARGKQNLNKRKIGVEPESPYKAEYPYNRVITTKAGHAIELDSTPGDERVHIYHKSGSYVEINKDGRIVIKSVDDSYEVVAKDKHLYVEGQINIEVKGELNALVHGKTNIVSKSDIDIISEKKVNIQGMGGVSIKSGSDIAMAAPGGAAVTQGGISSLGPMATASGVSGTFSTPSGKTVHVQKGIVTNIT